LEDPDGNLFCVVQVADTAGKTEASWPTTAK
jgi:hypothetical protein